jgi:hypothetical protein
VADGASVAALPLSSSSSPHAAMSMPAAVMAASHLVVLVLFTFFLPIGTSA